MSHKCFHNPKSVSVWTDGATLELLASCHCVHPHQGVFEQTHPDRHIHAPHCTRSADKPKIRHKVPFTYPTLFALVNISQLQRVPTNPFLRGSLCCGSRAGHFHHLLGVCHFSMWHLAAWKWWINGGTPGFPLQQLEVSHTNVKCIPVHSCLCNMSRTPTHLRGRSLLWVPG